MEQITDWKLWKVFDCNNIELPGHYSGRDRTYDEAKKLMENLNKNGEFKPYTINNNNMKKVVQVCKYNCDKKQFTIKVGNVNHTFCCEKGFNISLTEFTKSKKIKPYATSNRLEG